jgi:endonuclease/exonuclease/phosphatase family metal-dependent hydrolase
MRIASFNVENLFSRVRAMNTGDWSVGQPILAEYSRLNALLQKPTYTAADRTRILASLTTLGLRNKDDGGPHAILRQNRGKLLKRPPNAPVQVVAGGRGDWIGWVELKTEAVNEIATRMTAKVIDDVGADILAVIEAEDRIALIQFHRQLLEPINARYASIMLIDGNDERGIDVGLLTRKGFAIESIVSHVDDSKDGRPIFSRDCPEYTVRTPGGTAVLVMVNHLKSKIGSAAASNARRKEQAKRVRAIYEQRRSEGVSRIAVVGDFNDTPSSDALKPLLGSGSDLRDVFTHPRFADDGHPGTFGSGTAGQKFDYLLLSPALWSKVTAAGVNRMGVWGGTNGTLFPHFPEMTEPVHAASDHAAVWADLNV